jgi:hypothetical protein
MAAVEFSDEEKDVLVKVLEEDVSELRYEIANTDSFDYRQGLKHKEEVMRTILDRLRGS